MDISKRNAMQIVNEISGIIGQHVNMMDADGTIIASTDPERVDTYHEGAARVIGEHLDELIIQDDDEYEGTRKGINLPILLDGEIAGVVGITGERDEVVKYGQIIKKMTEILLIENFDKEQKKIDDRIRTRFIDEWLYGDAASQGQAFVERGARLGIDITLPRRVLVAEIENLRDYSDSPEGQRIIDRVNKTVRRMVGEEKNGVFTKTASQMICLMPDGEDAKLRFFAQQIQAQVWRQFSIRVIVGADSRDGSLLHQSYLRAQKALRACRASRGSTIRFYDDINLELFMDEIRRPPRRNSSAASFAASLPRRSIPGCICWRSISRRTDRCPRRPPSSSSTRIPSSTSCASSASRRATTRAACRIPPSFIWRCSSTTKTGMS